LAKITDEGLSSNQSDSDLKHLLLDDNEAVLAMVLRSFGPAVAASLRRRYLILNENDVEDVLATALYRLWAYRKRLDLAKGPLATLFYRIADNTVRNLFKTGWHQLRSQEVRLDNWNEIVEAPARSTDEEPRNPGTIRQDLQGIIDSLPAAYRYIVLADATAKDRVASAELIAEELEIPAGTVRVYRSRAMNAIRSKLRALGYNVP
jgi:RNA polymerase sigma factor (sigma-70 family)